MKRNIVFNSKRLAFTAYVMRCFHVCCMNLKVKLMIIGQLVLVTEM